MESLMNDYITKKVNISDLRLFSTFKELAKEIDTGAYKFDQRMEILVGSSILENIDKIKSIMKPEDELIIYYSQEWTWDCLAGRSGYAIVRSGEIIYEQSSWIS